MLCCCENSEHHGKAQSHIKPNIGKIPLEKLTFLELQEFCRKLLISRRRIHRVESKKQAKDLSPKTVRSIHQFIATDHTSGRTTDGLPERGMYYGELPTGLRQDRSLTSKGRILTRKKANSG